LVLERYPAAKRLMLERVLRVIDVNFGTFRGWVRHTLALVQWLSGGLDAQTQVDLRQTRRLVFVCLGNINRSCFAEAVARRLGVSCTSFGLSTTTGASAYVGAAVTAPRFGLDLTGHCATNIDDYRPEPGDLLLVMEVRHLHRLRQAGLGHLPTALLGTWSYPRRIHIHDPHKLSPEYFITCFTVIESATRALVAEWNSAGREGA
jgi:protein-tyrosine phosphatase